MRTKTHDIADVLFPRVRQCVLSELLTRPEQQVHLRELARRSGLAPATLHREVLSLTAAGILERRTEGRQVYYRANTRCPVFNELRGLMVKTVRIVYALREALKPLRDRIEYALVFGSVADGTSIAESDLDLLVVGTVDLVGLSPHLRKAREATGREINAVTLTREAFVEAAQGGDPFIETVLDRPILEVMGEVDELRKLVG